MEKQHTPITIQNTLFRHQYITLAIFILCFIVSLGTTNEASAQNNPPLIDTIRACTEPMTPTVICHRYIDPDGDATFIDHEETSTTFNCSLVALDDTCYRYTPLPGFFGTDTIFVKVCDDGQPIACSTSIVYMHIGCIAPEVNTDNVVISSSSVIINGNTSNNPNGTQGIIIDVIDNDIPNCGGDLSIENIARNPSNGNSAIINSTQVSYTPNSGYTGLDSLRYTSCTPSCDSCATAAVIINILAGEAPCNTDITDCTGPFNPLQICPTFCDINTNAIVQLTGNAQQGTVDPPVNNCFQYIPDAAFAGVDNISFQACDAMGNCETSSAFITIDPACGTAPPVANDDNSQTLPSTPVTIPVRNNDTDPDGDVLTITTTTPPANGTIVVDAATGQIVYTPNPNFTGTDQFTYTVCDPTNQCDQARVTVNVTQSCNDSDYNYCTDPFMPVEICVEFCSFQGRNDIEITSAHTTFNCSINLLENLCLRYTPLPGFVGLDTVNIIGCVPEGICDTVYAQVNVGCITPTANDDTQTTTVNTPVAVPILVNDTEPCDRPLSPTILQQPTNGTAVVNGDGTVTYSPNTDYTGTDSFVYGACSDCEDPNNTGQRFCDEATVTITIPTEVQPPTTPLNPQPDVAQTPFETPIDVAVLNNDTGSGLTVTSVSQPQNGTATSINPNGAVTYSPNAGFSGVDNFFYTVCDASDNCREVLVTITVLPDVAAPQPPIANNDVATTLPNQSVNIAVTGNDSDPENGPLVIGEVTQPSNGTAEPNPDGTIKYTPNPDFTGQDNFTYTVCDNQGMCATATVSVTVNGTNTPSNRPPLAVDNQGTTQQNTPITISILGNDSDPDGHQITPTIIANPTNGTVALQADGSVIYTPTNGYIGTDFFTYQICDNGTPSLCDTAVVQIMIVEPPMAFLANPDVEQTPFQTPITISVLMNDVGGVSTNAVTEPENGRTVVNDDGTVTYTPNDGFSGPDYFFYQVCDASGVTCEFTLVSVTVLPENNTPQPPVAQNDVESTTPGNSVVIPIQSNDNDPEGSPLNTTEVTDPVNGSTRIEPDGTVVYTPDPDFSGLDTFSYTICDDQGLCDEATVGVSVGPTPPMNNAPLAMNDLDTTAINTPITIDIMQNDSAPDGNMIVATLTSNPTNGTAVIQPDNSATYTPNDNYSGNDYFTYQICDDGIPSLCDTAYVSIFIAPNAPEGLDAEPDVVQTPFETPIAVPVVNNDEGNGLNITDVTEPENGNVNPNPDGTITYTPNDGFVGTDYFFYTVCDQNAQCEEAIVSVTVLPENASPHPPTAHDDVETTDMGTPVVIPILSNDSDPEGEPLTISNVGNPQNGTVMSNPNGTVTYTPNPDFVGVDNFTYEVCDAQDLCSEATVTVSVGGAAINQPPIAVDDRDTTDLNTPVTFNIQLNDSDPDGNAISSLPISAPAHGIVSIDGNGNATYTPDSSYQGVDYFTYQICDDGVPVLCDTAAVTIVIGNGNLPPDAVDDNIKTGVNAPTVIFVLSNDRDPNHANDELVVSPIITPPMNGEATSSGTSINYLPGQDFMGVDSLQYAICDPLGLCDTAWVFITIEEFPDAQPDIEYTLVNTPVTIQPMDNDGGAGITITEFTQPQNGTVEQGPDGTVIYTPNPDYVGSDYFFYTICDVNNNCEETIVNIQVAPENQENRPPIANNDVDTTPIDESVEVNVLANDSEPDNQPIIVTSTTQPQNGTTAILNDGESVVYLPDAGYTGIDSFTYTICDNDTPPLCDTATVVITIGTNEPSNNPPIAGNNEMTTDINTPVNIPILGNDFDPDADNITITNITEPTNGEVVEEEDGTVTYVPDNGFAGIDYFVYTICDDGIPSLCDTAHVTITVEGDEVPPNLGEIINVSTLEDVDTIVCLEDFITLENVIDTILIYDIPENGSPYYPENNDSCIAYSPDADFTGEDSFTIGLCDNAGVCDTVTINVTVRPTTDPPIAVDDIDTTAIDQPITIDVLDNDTDPDGDPLVILPTGETTTPNGTIEITQDGFVYTPNPGYQGTDTFTYVITDPTQQTDTATVIVVILPEDSIPDLPDPPGGLGIVASNDRDTTEINTTIMLPVLENDDFPTDSMIIITIIDEPDNGTVTVNEDIVDYEPNNDFVGNDTFTYTICAGITDSLCDTAQVIITITDGTPVTVDCDPDFPAGFSPNEDGFNEEFLIGGLDDPCFDDIPLKLIIFNRWGDIVYLVNNYDNSQAWDGTFQRNGNPVPEGTYFYLLWYEINNEEQDQSGFVEIKR